MTKYAKTVELNHVCSKIGVGLAMAVTPYMMESGVKLIRNQNIRPNKFDSSSVVYVDPEFAASQKTKTIHQGDVVIVRTGAKIGDACVVPEEFDGAQSFTTLVARTNTEMLVPAYLAQFINSHLGQAEVERLMAGGGKGNLNAGELERFRINLLPLEAQHRAAAILGTWDVAIEKCEQLAALRDRMYTHELSRLVSRSKYPRKHVGAFAQEFSVRNHLAACERVLSVTNTRGFVLPEDQFERRVASEDITGYKVVSRGQYAYNPSRINVGSIARLDAWDVGVLSPMYVVFGLDETRIHSDFFLHWLNSREARERIKKCTQGSVRESVSFSEFAGIPIPSPEFSGQTAVARYLNALREEVSILRIYLEKLKQQKRGLMQELLSGQWRATVSDAAAA